MTYPIPNYTRVWVRGRIIDLGKAALQEDNYGLALPVTFSPSPKVLLNAGTGQIISTAPFKITPAAQDGYFAIQLPATDDPDINPTNFTYAVKEPTGRSYNIVVPAATPLLNSPADPLHGQPVLDLITIVPSPPAGAGSVQLLTGLPGRGITSVDNVAGDLVVTYTDSTTQNLGPISGGASKLTDLTDVTTTGAAVGQLVVVSVVNAGVPSFELVDTAEITPAEIGAQSADADLTAIADLVHANDTILQTKAGVWSARTPAQVKTDLSLVKGDVGLGNVDNTADSAKPVSTAVQAALDARAARLDVLAAGQNTLPRAAAVAALTMTSGVLRLAYFTSIKTETVNSVRVLSSSTAAGATPTLVRYCLFSVAGNGDLTLLAATPSDTTVFGGVNSSYARTLASGVSLTAGSRYAVGVLVVTSATAPTVWGASPVTSAEAAVEPRIAAALTGQTDLPASITSGTLTASSALVYAAVTP